MRPIDLQGMVHKTQNVEKLQRVQEYGSNLTQDQFSEHLRKRAEESLRRVEHSKEALPGRVSERKKGRRDGKTGTEGDGRDEREEKDSPREPIEGDEAQAKRGRHIDVKA